MAASGLRWIARTGSGPFELALAHGDPRVDPRGVVITGVLSRTDTDGIDIYDSLATRLMLAENEAPAGREGTAELARWTQDLLTHVPGPAAWRDTSIELDGTPAHFRQLKGQYGWAAFRELDPMWLYVESLRIAPSELHLDRIGDLSAYIDGTEILET